MRFALLALLLLIQQPSQVPPPAATSVPADYAAKRELALAPALKFISQNDYVAALAALSPVLEAYPRDLRVLYLTADIARITGDTPQALALYQRCLDLKATDPGAIRLGFVRTYADLGRWEEFNRERSAIRQLALTGDRTLSVEHGYLIEDHRAGKLHFQVLEFPSTDPAAVTRFRALVLSAYKPGYIPSIDLEANPGDAASFSLAYPRQAAAQARPWALVSYPDAHTRGFLKFYPDGEPAYEDLRADVIRFAPHFGPAAAVPSSRPTYKPAPAPPKP